MGLVGYGVMVGIPVISSAWSEKLGYTAEQVGRVAGADMGGLSLGAVVVALIISKMNRRHLVVYGSLITIFANYLCTVFEQYEAENVSWEAHRSDQHLLFIFLKKCYNYQVYF